MSKKEKLLDRLLSLPKDFTWQETVTLMKSYGFTVLKGNGSRRKFFNEEKDIFVSMHEPHPTKILKRYQLNDLIDVLNKGEFI